MRADIIFEIQEAILKKQKKYHDVELPRPQTSGTDYQNKSYAFKKAQEIFHKYFDK